MSQEEKKIISDPDQRITPNILSRFEIAKVLSVLAQNIANGEPFDQQILEEIDEITAENIAERLLELGTTNLIIYRQTGDNTEEVWFVDEMIYYKT